MGNMGCITASRFERRNADLDDFNTMDIAIMGGDGRPLDQDICPVDKAFLNYDLEITANSRDNTGGWAKEVYEILKIDKHGDIDDQSEELARSKLKTIINFLENMKSHIEKEGRRTRDYKKVLVGQKYTTQEVLEQLNSILVQLTTYMDESPTAAQVLDLDNLSGMRSETIKGDVLAWKKLPKFLIKLSLENPYLFDFIKYEVMRAELDNIAQKQYAYVLWENKSFVPDLRRVGLISGMMSECVSKGSVKRGLEKKEDSTVPAYEENIWAITPKLVFMTGRITQDNLESLVEMAERK